MDDFLCRDCGTARKETDVGGKGLNNLTCYLKTDTGDTCGGTLVRITNHR